MEIQEAIFQEFLKLPERVEKLETALWEQHLLIGMLLGRSGLNEEKTNEAFALASKTWKEYKEQRSQQAWEEWAKTPEGEETLRRNAEVRAQMRKQREKELWREECLEEGRIVPAQADKPQEPQ